MFFDWHVDAAVWGWMVGALVGVIICSVMVLDAIALTRAARTDAERFIAWGDLVQWGAGFAIKVVGFYIGFWVLCLPPTGQLPDTGIERWAAAQGRWPLIGGLLVMVWGMDFRDVVLVALKRQLRAVLRQEAKERAEHDA